MCVCVNLIHIICDTSLWRARSFCVSHLRRKILHTYAHRDEHSLIHAHTHKPTHAQAPPPQHTHTHTRTHTHTLTNAPAEEATAVGTARCLHQAFVLCVPLLPYPLPLPSRPPVLACASSSCSLPPHLPPLNHHVRAAADEVAAAGRCWFLLMWWPRPPPPRPLNMQAREGAFTKWNHDALTKWNHDAFTN